MEETQSERLHRKIREQPFMPIGKLKKSYCENHCKQIRLSILFTVVI